MIAVQRTVEPKILQRHGTRWLSKLKSVLSDPQATKREKENAVNKYQHEQIKDTLNNMFLGKCAYCESEITAISYGHIEHFWPKSKYVDKTFQWENLLLACDKCNDTNHKGVKFPLDANGSPLLIDPTDGTTQINQHLRFQWNEATLQADVVPLDERGREVVTIFDLNGDHDRKELREFRSLIVRCLIQCAKDFQVRQDREALEILQIACQPSKPYSAFTRTLCAEHNIPVSF